MKRTLSRGLTALLLLALLPACSPAGSGGATPAPEPTPTGPGDVLTGRAHVTSVELLMLESFPVQVHAVVKGGLPDAWTFGGSGYPSGVEQRRDGNTFYVEISTYRPLDMSCAQVITPFEHTVTLDVVGLPAGTYTVDVNGVTGTFKLDVDNKLP